MLRKKTPETLPEWLVDVQEAYQFAFRQFHAGTLQFSSITDLFKLAAPVVAERRSISSPELVQEMADYVQEGLIVILPWELTWPNTKFNFVYLLYPRPHTSRDSGRDGSGRRNGICKRPVGAF